ncbi:hypothetical protein DPMN_130214 [Dreissena polymorpha]|uniref:Uncharacterized protein n=1 Tax=Dreissena polymorpha TaxID=45954 RepID=A0A9D4JY80_DREPO|nr:hypothetical protein DPMN_130214 [Dreissena polymorpha]
MCQITPSEVAVVGEVDIEEVNIAEDYTHEVQFLLVNQRRFVKGAKIKFQHRCYGIAHYKKDL